MLSLGRDSMFDLKSVIFMLDIFRDESISVLLLYEELLWEDILSLGMVGSG